MPAATQTPRRAGSPAAPAGSEPRRRRRAPWAWPWHSYDGLDGRGFMHRQRHDEARALAGEGIDRDRPTVGLDEPLRDRQPESRTRPRPTAGLVAAIERLEDPLAL